MKRILVLCTGNRCRSQMAQGILQSLDFHTLMSIQRALSLRQRSILWE